jgi:hypothetical protein
MERTIALALNKFPSVPLTLRETPTNDTARKEIRINLADLFHHYYHNSYGRSPPNPDPAQFEHLRFLVPEEGFRIQGDGIGISTAVRRNRSIELGQAFCRWFLHEHLNMTYFAHMKQALDGQLHPTYFAHHLERTQKGDTPDYFCARNANDVFLAEAKGGYEAAGLQSGLLDEDYNQHSLHPLNAGGAPRAIILNEYILRRNLPDEHQLIRDVF